MGSSDLKSIEKEKRSEKQRERERERERNREKEKRNDGLMFDSETKRNIRGARCSFPMLIGR